MAGKILRLADHEESRETEFEIDYLLSLTVEQRVQLVLERSRLLLEMLASNGHPVVPGIIKRT